jgi:3'-phosphoadenosine 5'-phosphosulfate sulfotransferase (PAPS reductase)/FAD synthetase
MGPIPIAVDSYQVEGGPLCVFPIRSLTDEEIWRYTEIYHVPYNEKRYDKSNGYAEFEDLTFNNDWYPACVRCMDATQPEKIFCPKDGREIQNRCNEVRRVEAKPMEVWAEVK